MPLCWVPVPYKPHVLERKLNPLPSGIDTCVFSFAPLVFGGEKKKAQNVLWHGKTLFDESYSLRPLAALMFRE